MKLEDRKYMMSMSIDMKTDEVLLKVGEGNRSKGVRLLAQQWAERNTADIRNEMEDVYPGMQEDGSQALLPVPGDPDFKY